MQSSAARKMTAEGWLEPPPLPHHYDTIENHQSALRFGMWLFLGTEVLLFAGIFVGYFVFRSYFPESFEQAARHLSVKLGTANTLFYVKGSYLCGPPSRSYVRNIIGVNVSLQVNVMFKILRGHRSRNDKFSFARCRARIDFCDFVFQLFDLAVNLIPVGP